jgi:hypothetical protein
MFIENKNFIVIAIAVIVVIFLITQYHTTEGFSTIQRWPYYPKPTNWKSPKSKFWNPWWYEQNEDSTYPANPTISNYDTKFYRFPKTNCLQPKPTRPLKPLIDSPCGTPYTPFAKYDINSMSNPFVRVNANGMDGIVVERFGSTLPAGGDDELTMLACQANKTGCPCRNN